MITKANTKKKKLYLKTQSFANNNTKTIFNVTTHCINNPKNFQTTTFSPIEVCS